MDSDSNAQNGLQISDAIHDFFKGKALDFNKQLDQFKSKFEKMLVVARQSGIFKKAIPLYKVLDNLYEGVGLEPVLWAKTSVEQDNNADSIINFRQTSTYDANGNLTSFEEYLDADRIVDSRSTFTYDANGNKTSFEQDNNADRIVDSRSIFTYDANGNLTSVERDNDGDGPEPPTKINNGFTPISSWKLMLQNL